MYTVKEVADILGVSVHTVRYYDDQGLIPGTKRDSYNQRIFDDMELEWLFVSISLRDTGLPLKEIKRYIELYQQGDSTLQQVLLRPLRSNFRVCCLQIVKPFQEYVPTAIRAFAPTGTGRNKGVPLSAAILTLPPSLTIGKDRNLSWK